MIRELGIRGVYELGYPSASDSRGTTRDLAIFSDLDAAGVIVRFEREMLTKNPHIGTVRGLHYQRQPFPQQKLVTCIRGLAFDVVVDLRKESPTFGTWISMLLNETNNSVFIPEGCAHGYQTCEPDTLILYRIAGGYVPEYASGINPFDVQLGVPWPIAQAVANDRDRALPAFAMLDVA